MTEHASSEVCADFDLQADLRIEAQAGAQTSALSNVAWGNSSMIRSYGVPVCCDDAVPGMELCVDAAVSITRVAAIAQYTNSAVINLAALMIN